MGEGQQAMLRAIREQPGDDTVRLAYADWLDEHEQPDRAEFIRLQCELQKYPAQANWLEQMPVEQWAGSEVEGELLRKLDPLVRRHTALSDAYVRDCAPWSRDFIQSLCGHSCLQLTAAWYWGWTRGFVSHVTFTLRDYTEYAARLFELQPVERVVLVGVVRDGIVFRTSNGHHNDIPRELWEELGIPQCNERGEGRGTHAHLTEEELSVYLVNRGRKLAGLPVVTTSGASGAGTPHGEGTHRGLG